MGKQKASAAPSCSKCHKYPTYNAVDRWGDQDTYCTGCKRPEYLCTCKRKANRLKPDKT